MISQTPAAGTQVTSGSTVALVVSSGLPQVAVPNVVGLTQTAATTAITNAGLNLGAVTTASSTTVPSGSVIGQTPSAGTQVASGSAVALVVSSGPAQVTVPNVVGLAQTAATNSMLSAGLTLISVTTTPSAIVPAGLVISQTPVAGAQVPATTSVNLVISSGPPLVSVPNVVGLTQAAASTAITNAGLTVGAITTASSTIVPAGAVIEQSPVATTPVVAGSALALLVSSGPPAPAALTIDNTISVDGSGTLTTPPFSTKAGDEMLLLFATSMGPTSLSLKQSLAISGAGLDWTLVNRVNSQFGTAEVWRVYASAPLVNATVTSVQSLTVAGGFHQSLTLIAFQGAGGTGAIGAASAMFGATIGSLTTTRPGSLVYGVANDSARAAARTMGPNQTMVHQWIDTLGASTFWVQALSAPVDAAGSVATISDVTPTSDRWNLATVEILVGSTATSPTVPNVVGLTQTTATTTLTDAGFIVGDVTTASSTTVPSGIVLSQTPAAFARAASGSAVAIVVSSGPAKVAVPSVVGVTQAAATTAITNAGLVVGSVSTASSTTVPSGSVISQTPAAATQVATGSSVSFVVSTGAPQVAVPNVVGLTQAAAATAIANSGLVVGGITTEPSTDGAGRVGYQSDAHGGHAGFDWQFSIAGRVFRLAAGRRAKPRRPDSSRRSQRLGGCGPVARQPHERPEHDGADRIRDQSDANCRCDAVTRQHGGYRDLGRTGVGNAGGRYNGGGRW